MRSWWVAVAVGLAVALVVGAGYAVVRSGDSSGVDPSARTTPTGSPTTLRPAEPPPPRSAVPPVRRQVPVVGYEPTPQADRLRLHYYIGVPECYGVVDPEHGVTVAESEHTVRVALTRTPPAARSGTACIDLALARSLTVHLDAPLGARAVVDMTTGRQVPRRALDRGVHPDCPVSPFASGGRETAADARTPGRCGMQRPGAAAER